jgi:hypothetical protein
MYSLTIHFGPNAMCWAFLFKEKEVADRAKAVTSFQPDGATHFSIVDDFGQYAQFAFTSVHGVLLEDLDLVEEARIQRSLYNARGEVKARQRASTDAVIRTGMGNSGAGVLTPFRQ